MSTSAVQWYLDQVVETFSVAAGRPLGSGTSVVPFGDRTSSVAVAYLLPGRTLVACSTDVAGRLRRLDGLPALDETAWRRCTRDLGGGDTDGGVNHVLPGSADLSPRSPRAGCSERWLDTTAAADAALLARFIESSSADDLDEAEIDPETPDPAICVLVDADGSVVAYASGRPFWAAASTDDIGVLVAPAHRGQGLGPAVVSAYARRRREVMPQLYRHADSNLASARVARSVGFVAAHRVSAVDFDVG